MVWFSQDILREHTFWFRFRLERSSEFKNRSHFRELSKSMLRTYLRLRYQHQMPLDNVKFNHFDHDYVLNDVKMRLWIPPSILTLSSGCLQWHFEGNISGMGSNTLIIFLSCSRLKKMSGENFLKITGQRWTSLGHQVKWPSTRRIMSNAIFLVMMTSSICYTASLIYYQIVA